MRRATGRPLVLGFLGGYHGETATTAALGAEVSELGRGVRAITAGYFHIPYPNPFRNPFAGPRPGGSGDATIDYLRDHVLFHAVDPADVAGVVIEPVLGSGGVVTPPQSFFPALAELCAEHGWLLCADEVKTGCGRCGTFLAVERLGVDPGRRMPGQGARRRRRADRGRARLGASARRVRRRVHRQHLVVAAHRLRGRPRLPRRATPAGRTRPCARDRGAFTGCIRGAGTANSTRSAMSARPGR